MLEARLDQTPEFRNYALQRRWPRYSIDVEVKVSAEISPGSVTHRWGRASEIGEGGMAIFVAHEFDIGDAIRIAAKFPYAGRALECVAIVRNRNSYCYGVEFLGLGHSEREFVSRTCRFLSIIQ